MDLARRTLTRLRLMVHLGLSLTVCLAPVLGLVVPRPCCGGESRVSGLACPSCVSVRTSSSPVKVACCGTRPAPARSKRACCSGDMSAVKSDRGSAAFVLDRDCVDHAEAIDNETSARKPFRDSSGFGCRDATCRCGDALPTALELPQSGRNVAEQLVTTLEWGSCGTRHDRVWGGLAKVVLWPPDLIPQASPPIYSSGAATALLCCWLC